jgi:uncharacterized membrane protein YfcA
LTPADLAVAAAVLLAGAVQSGTGFGFSLVAVPALAAAYGPAAAVSTATLASLLQNSLTLAGERRRPEALWRVVVTLVVAGLPGMALGAVVLKRAPDDALHLLVAVAVLGAVAARLLRGRKHEPTNGVVAGAIAGAMATSTGINGPPVVLHLLRRGITPMETRDTLAAFFVATGVLTVVALALAGTFDLAPFAGVAILAAAAGQFIGRGVFMRLDAEQHERVTLGLLVVSAVVAAVPALV